MKNILVYVNPNKKFDNERDLLCRLQIDNSIRLGWRPQDILLVTNFDYEYNGVKSTLIDDSVFRDFRPLSTKTIAISHMLNNDMINDVCWVHDFDAYQMNELDPDLSGFGCGFTTYGWSPKWQLGSYFVTKKAKDLFNEVVKIIDFYKTEDERALHHLTKNDAVSGYKRLNITYNFGMRNVDQTYPMAVKPLRVLHFHPHYMDTTLKVSPLQTFMYGKGPLGFPLMDDGLINLFREYGIK